MLKHIGKLKDARTDLEQQHQITQFLHQSNVRVGFLLTPRDGGCYSTDGEDAFIVMPHIEREPTDLHVESAGPIYHNIGRAYGHLHKAFLSYEGEIKSWRTDLYHRLYGRTGPNLLENNTGEQHTKIDTMLLGLHDPIAFVSPHLTEQPILWDCHPGNTLLYNGQVSGFVDCDHISLGPRICDLGNFAANLVARNCTHDRTTPWLKNLPHLIEGYVTLSPLTPYEKKAFPLSIPFFLLVLLNHFQTHGPHKNAEETLNSVWWVYNHLDHIREALNNENPH